MTLCHIRLERLAPAGECRGEFLLSNEQRLDRVVYHSIGLLWRPTSCCIDPHQGKRRPYVPCTTGPSIRAPHNADLSTIGEGRLTAGLILVVCNGQGRGQAMHDG